MTAIEDFRTNLVSYAERVQRVREHVKNEEATKVALILPFIALLGYDDRDPTEVAAEHAADFSEKYRNRVDYAILKAMNPIIARECKSIGNGKKRRSRTTEKLLQRIKERETWNSDRRNRLRIFR